MSDTEFTAVVGIGGVIIGAIISGLVALITLRLTLASEASRRKSEEQRWYLDHFLPSKLEKLNDLYSSLKSLELFVEPFVQYIQLPDMIFAEAEKRVEQANLALGLASVYFSESEQEQLKISIRDVFWSVEERWPSHPGDPTLKSQQELEAEAKKALDQLKTARSQLNNMISPPLLQHLNDSFYRASTTWT